MLTIRMNLWVWDRIAEAKVLKPYNVTFRDVHSMEELKNKLESVVLRQRWERDAERVERELDGDSCGVEKGWREVYGEDVNGRVRAHGGGEATGSRKSTRECRGKKRAEETGEWDMNL